MIECIVPTIVADDTTGACQALAVPVSEFAYATDNCAATVDLTPLTFDITGVIPGDAGSVTVNADDGNGQTPSQSCGFTFVDLTVRFTSLSRIHCTERGAPGMMSGGWPFSGFRDATICSCLLLYTAHGTHLCFLLFSAPGRGLSC